MGMTGPQSGSKLSRSLSGEDAALGDSEAFLKQNSRHRVAQRCTNRSSILQVRGKAAEQKKQQCRELKLKSRRIDPSAPERHRNPRAVVTGGP
eukprot:scaffold486_cov254-Pinguiococcus_pyrenoidosus.AAC.7